jgi:hypothetical protein
MWYWYCQVPSGILVMLSRNRSPNGGTNLDYYMLMLFAVPTLSTILIGLIEVWGEMFGNKRTLPFEGMDRPTAKVQFGVLQPFKTTPIMESLRLFPPIAEALPEPSLTVTEQVPILDQLAALADSILAVDHNEECLVFEEAESSRYAV